VYNLVSQIDEIYKFVIKFFSDSYSYIGLIGLLSGTIVAISGVFVYLFFKKKTNPFNRALKMYAKGNIEKSRVLLRIELNKNPTNRKALHLIADIECQEGDYRNAEKDYYRLLDLKKPGDDIDVQIVRKKLLEPLYRQEKLSETLNMIRQILSLEKTNAISLYYLSLLYLGQLYYKEAEVFLEKLIRNRPEMSQALFAYSVTLAQVHNFENSLQYMKKVMEIEEKPLYRLCLAVIYYLNRNYSISRDTLTQIKKAERVFSSKQYLLFLRLDAFVNYMLGSYIEAGRKFKNLYEYYNKGEPDKNILVGDAGIYNEFGKKKNISAIKPVQDKKTSSIFKEYFELKEIALEQNGALRFKQSEELSSSRFLGIEGLTSQTWAAMDYGFAMIKCGELEKAHNFFLSLKKEYPEIIGLKGFLQLISEKIEVAHNKMEHFNNISNLTEKVISRGKRKYELWEYIARWEKDSIRPYHLLIAGGFTTRKQLNPALLYRATKLFDKIG